MSTEKSTAKTDTANFTCAWENRTIKGRNDEYCIGCWTEAWSWFNTYGCRWSQRWGYVQPHVDREECMDSNLKIRKLTCVYRAKPVGIIGRDDPLCKACWRKPNATKGMVTKFASGLRTWVGFTSREECMDANIKTDDCDLICNYRTQAVEGRDDEFCKTCWDEAEELADGGEFSDLMVTYLDHEFCKDGNLKTLEEYSKLWRE